MKTLSLNGSWKLTIPGSEFPVVPATVPGSVYHDLLTAALIPDPFYRDNEMEALKLMENEFVHSRSFCVDSGLLSGDKVLLRAEGLDTIASVSVNDQVVGLANNMHRIWEFDIKDILVIGENTITVHFSSPTKYIKEAYAVPSPNAAPNPLWASPITGKPPACSAWIGVPGCPEPGTG